MTGVDACESHPDQAQLVNADAPREIAKACHTLGIRLVFFSTDYVFDGRRGPFNERRRPQPLNVYGRTKLAGERNVLAAHPEALVVRTSANFGWGRARKKTNSVTWILELLRRRQPVPLLTHTGPKQLLPLVNKPNVLYCVEDLRDAGITDIGIILGDNMPEKVRELLGDGSRYGVHFTYLVQGPPKGIAHAIACARDFVGRDAFCVYLGDNVLKGGIRHMVEEFQANNHDAGIALCPVAHPERFGVAELDAAGNVAGLVEKPKEPKSNLALVGIYLLRPSIFPIIDRLKPSWRNELEITDAIEGLRKGGGKVKAYVVKGWWKDTGRPEDVLEANHLLLEDIEAE